MGIERDARASHQTSRAIKTGTIHLKSELNTVIIKSIKRIKKLMHVLKKTNGVIGVM